MDVFFVERDAQGQVVGLYATPQYGRTADAVLPADDPEVAAFIAQQYGTTNNQGGSNA